jgi:transposase-like protein
MKNDSQFPKDLLEAIRYFSDPDNCLSFMTRLRWPDGITCPGCGCKAVSFIKTRRLWICKDCKKNFTVKVGTIMQDSPIRLDKWLIAIWMIANAKDGVSSLKAHRILGITQKSAWFMLHRIKLAMQDKRFESSPGPIVRDETLTRSKARNTGKGKREKIQSRAPIVKKSR